MYIYIYIYICINTHTENIWPVHKRRDNESCAKNCCHHSRRNSLVGKSTLQQEAALAVESTVCCGVLKCVAVCCSLLQCVGE